MGLFTKPAPARGGTPFRQHLNGIPDVGQGSGWTDTQWRAAPVRSVRLTGLIATNRGHYLDEQRVASYVRSSPGGKPYVLEHRGRLYCVDGHHRATAAYRRGDTHIRVHVKRLD